MPYTLRYDHPDRGKVTITNITKLEGVWFLPLLPNMIRRLTHYRIYVGDDPYTHHRVNDLVLIDSVMGLWVSNEEVHG